MTVANAWGQAERREGLLWRFHSCRCGPGGGSPEEQGVCGVDTHFCQSEEMGGGPNPFWGHTMMIWRLHNRLHLFQVPPVPRKTKPWAQLVVFLRHVSKPNSQIDQLDVSPVVLLPCSSLTILPPPSSHWMGTLVLFWRMESLRARTAKRKQRHL